MLSAGITEDNGATFVPFDYDPERCLRARQKADECFSEHAELERYLLLSYEGNKDTVKSKTKFVELRKKRQGKNRGITTESIYLHEKSGLVFEINNPEGCGIHTNILEAGINQALNCFNRWNRMMAYRVDLHMKEPEANNEMMSKLLKSLNKKLKARFPRHKNLGYIWVAETGSKSHKKHYHLHLYISGHVVRTGMLILPMIKESWSAVNDGNIVAPKSYSKYITSPEELPEIIRTMSYLAKTRDKGFQVKGANDFGSSRIKAA